MLAFVGLSVDITALMAKAAAPHRLPDEVLLLINTNSPTSWRIGRDYAAKRRVDNILYLGCQDSAKRRSEETISLAAYRQLIENPARAYLRQHTNISFLVLTKGIPLRIRGSAYGSCDEHSREPAAIRGHHSVDSTLAAMDYTNLPGTLTMDITGSGAVGLAYSNRYWLAKEPFSHTKFGGYLVTRLDGYTEAQALALTERALAAEQTPPGGAVLLDVQPQFGLGKPAQEPASFTNCTILRESAWDTYNADMQNANDLLGQRHLPAELDCLPEFVGGRTNLAGYFSWGSNDARYQAAAYQSLTFAAGSIADTAVSTSARTFLPTEGGQSLLADLLAHGLTCGKGYVDEPLLQANASPSVLMERYTSGYTMAESFYAASRLVGWEDVIIGDPLCAPYR